MLRGIRERAFPLAPRDSICCARGAEGQRSNLAPRATLPGVVVVADRCAHAMEKLAESNTAECGHEEVVQRRPVLLTEILPRERAEKRERNRFPVIEAV